MSNKKYRLLKDLPGKPAGILLSYSATLKMYQYEGYPSVDMGDGYFVYGELPALVENNPDWFQEVVEPEPNQPEFPVEEIKALTSMYKDMIAHIRQQKYTEADLDKARREGVSNGETMYSLEDVRKALHGEWGTGNAVENVLNRLRNYKK